MIFRTIVSPCAIWSFPWWLTNCLQISPWRFDCISAVFRVFLIRKDHLAFGALHCFTVGGKRFFLPCKFRLGPAIRAKTFEPCVLRRNPLGDFPGSAFHPEFRVFAQSGKFFPCPLVKPDVFPRPVDVRLFDRPRRMHDLRRFRGIRRDGGTRLRRIADREIAEHRTDIHIRSDGAEPESDCINPVCRLAVYFCFFPCQDFVLSREECRCNGRRCRRRLFPIS